MSARTCAVFCAALFASATALADGGRATLVEGKVQRSVGDAPAQDLKQGDAVAAGDHLITGNDGRLEVVFEDGSILRVGKNSKLDVQDLRFDPQSSTLTAKLHLALGEIWSHVEHLSANGSYEVQTDRAVAGVRGTEFRVDAVGDDHAVEVYQGRVAVAQLIAMRETNLNPDEQVAMMPKPLPAAERSSAAGAAAAAPPAADMQHALGATKPERIVEPNQRLEVGAHGELQLAALRTGDDFSAFIHRKLPSRDERERAFHRERRDHDPRRERLERRRERLERLRWRR